MSRDSFPAMPTSKNPASAVDLKQKLLQGALGAEAFLNALHALDQSTSDRVNAIENVEILTSPEVAELFQRNTENRNHYYYFLSFSYFHVAQRNHTGPSALENFAKSLAAADLVDDQEYQAWKDYVAGTVAYFEKNLPKLKNIHQRMQEEGRNKYILESFIEQLEAGKDTDYVAALVSAKREEGYQP